MNSDEWYALLDKIDMIPDKELADGMRDIFAHIQTSINRGFNKSKEQRWLRNLIDFILAKNSKDKEQTNA